jgi:hypothetical protein
MERADGRLTTRAASQTNDVFMDTSQLSKAPRADRITSCSGRRRLLTSEFWGASLIEAGVFLQLRNFGLISWGALQVIGIASFVVGLTAVGFWLAALPRPTTSLES